MALDNTPDDDDAVTDALTPPDSTQPLDAQDADQQTALSTIPSDMDLASNSLQVVENLDGSATLTEPGEAEESTPEFDENLAMVFPKEYLDTFGGELKEILDRDVDDRKKRDEQYAEGIRRTGLGNDAPGGAEFEGSSKAVHPMLAKGSVDFASRAIKELFPAGGPCKTSIIGDQTEAKVERAERKKKYMNWQCVTQIEEYRPELERLLSQVPLGGAAYKKWWWDDELKRPRTMAVFLDDVFTPYGSADFYTASRVSYRQMINQAEFDKRVRTGLYIDNSGAENPGVVSTFDKSKAREASDKVEGVDDTNALVYNEDGLRLVWQIELIVDEPLDDETTRPAPYIIHLDDATHKILGYFRNWKEGDKRQAKVHWMTEWSFIPWRDGPAIGLAHLIGTLAGASTGALRAMLDAAMINNFPGAIKLAGTRGAGESKSVAPTEITEIDAPTGVDDIRKVIMPFPFNPPSTVLYQILEWLTAQASDIVATASESISDATSEMPVGTALALIEHGSTNFSAVHARLHASLKRDLEIQHRLNADNMSDSQTVADLGELIVYRKDFEGPMDIIPVSDPNIFSEAQRYAQLQAVIQLKNDPSFAQYFKPDQLLGRALRLLNVPDIDGIANLPQEAKRLSPLEENYASAEGDPLKVYPEQDDLAHLKSHIHFCTSPMFGANPLIAPAIIVDMLKHCKEHLMALYKKHTMAATRQFTDEASNAGWKIDKEEAQLYGAAFADQLLSGLLAQIVMPGLAQMQKMATDIAQSNMPKPSPDTQATVNATLQLGIAKLKSAEALEQSEQNMKKQFEAMRAQNTAAQTASQEQLAKLATQTEMMLATINNGARQTLEEFKAGQQTQITILTQVLQAALTSAQEAGKDQGSKTNVIMPNGMNMAEDLLQPLLGGLSQTLQQSIMGMTSQASPMAQSIQGLMQQQQTFSEMLDQQRQQMQQMFGALTAGMAHLSQKASQNYEAEIYTGPDGVKRARRVPVDPNAAPNPAQPQLPAPGVMQ
jgi:hypothetical protein